MSEVRLYSPRMAVCGTNSCVWHAWLCVHAWLCGTHGCVARMAVFPRMVVSNGSEWYEHLGRNVKRFRGGLVFKTHTFVSLNSRRESNKEDEEKDLGPPRQTLEPLPGETRHYPLTGDYRGTSLVRNNPTLGPYRKPMSRALWWSYGGGLFLMSEVPLYPRSGD